MSKVRAPEVVEVVANELDKKGEVAKALGVEELGAVSKQGLDVAETEDEKEDTEDEKEDSDDADERAAAARRKRTEAEVGSPPGRRNRVSSHTLHLVQGRGPERACTCRSCSAG